MLACSGSGSPTVGGDRCVSKCHQGWCDLECWDYLSECSSFPCDGWDFTSYCGGSSCQRVGTRTWHCDMLAEGCGDYYTDTYTSSGCVVPPTNTPGPTTAPGTTPVPTTPPSSCPACCWPGTGQGTRYGSLDYLCGGIECWDSCNNVNWPSYGREYIFFFNDINQNGVWDVGEVQIPLGVGDTRIQGGTLSWSGGLGSGGQGSISVGSTEPQNSITSLWWGSEPDPNCRPKIFFEDQFYNGRPLLKHSQSFSGSFYVGWFANPLWHGISGCRNATLWLQDLGGGYSKHFYDVWVQVNGTGGNNVSFSFTPAVGSAFEPVVSTRSTFIQAVQAEAVDIEAMAFGIRAKPTPTPTPTPIPNPPTLNAFSIRNSNNLVVAAGASNRNHICQSQFRAPATPRQANFRVTIQDVDGLAQINSIRMRFNTTSGSYIEAIGSNLATAPSYSLSGTGASLVSLVGTPTMTTDAGANTRTVTFPLLFAQNFDLTNGFRLHDLQVYATDTTGQILNWTDTGRDFKVWDCLVPVSGSLYDSMGQSLTCPVFGTYFVGADMNFSNLQFSAITPVNTTVNSPNYSSGSGGLNWGTTYIPVFNANLNGSDPRNNIRLNDSNCLSGSVNLDDNNMDAYASPVTADIDFLSDQNQNPWFQCQGLSILARTSIRSNVPLTCAINVGCSQAVSIDYIYDNNGPLISSSISSNSGCSWCGNGTCCYRGMNNDWYKSSYSQNVKELSYDMFYRDLFVKKGVGRTATTWTQVMGVGGTGVVFVDGDLTINSNNTVNMGDFLMMVVSGNITVADSVSTVEGVFIIDGNLVTTGTSSSQLAIAGMIYTGGNINFGRSYTDQAFNGLSPSVRVTSRPDFIFNAPNYLLERMASSR